MSSFEMFWFTKQCMVLLITIVFVYVYIWMRDLQGVPLKEPHKASTADKIYPRILCWILCSPKDLNKRVIHVQNTWAKHCDISLYFSSKHNSSFPAIGLDVPEGRHHIALKSKAAWTHLYENFINEADYFVKGDPDTFIVIHHLKKYLYHRNPDKPEYFGHHLFLKKIGLAYNSGGPGQVLSRQSLRVLVKMAYANYSLDCMPDGQGEDWKTSLCLQSVGGLQVDTRDQNGKETFMLFSIDHHLRGTYPEWYYRFTNRNVRKGVECCSEYPIGFHYVTPLNMYLYDYFFYQVLPESRKEEELSKFTFLND